MLSSAECLADFTAQSVQSIHKLGQLLLITAIAVKQEPFSEFHGLIGRQISFFSNRFAQHISVVDTPSQEVCLLLLVFTYMRVSMYAFQYVYKLTFFTSCVFVCVEVRVTCTSFTFFIIWHTCLLVYLHYS